ncbi:MAG: hypothetical protein GY749_35455 [Desulfobacteraceae bacterium]|nr:hypothetical protein [Desulfobacteraceae bacterium]
MKTNHSNRRPACVFDLDGTLNHAAPAPGGFLIRGKTTSSVLSPETLERLEILSRGIDIIVATGRGKTWVADFERLFARAGVNVTGWILEHGGVVAGRPEWTRTVLEKIDLEAVKSEIEKVIRLRGFPVDYMKYCDDHESFILLSGKGRLLAEHFIDCISGILGNQFRSIVGKRKIALVPKLADKYAAFEANFGNTHCIAFAAGDHADDLTILKQAFFPLSLPEASPVVRKYIESRGGFIAGEHDHPGTAEILDKILEHLDKKTPGLPTPVPRIPIEEAELFRSSRCAYLNLLFAKTAELPSKPGAELLENLAGRLKAGKGIVIEARMRDWGGESKSLIALVRVIVPLLPFAHWNLVFNTDRLGIENLKTFNAVFEKLSDYALLPDGSFRFSAPGVPGTPGDPGKPSTVLLFFDHPDDMAPWYDLAITRLVTRCPGKPHTWFVNPMYLKTGACDAPVSCVEHTEKMLAGSRIMMAANVIGHTDIHIAVQGFQQLRDCFDSLIIAPRVVTNPERNRMIREAVRSIGQEAVFLSGLEKKDHFRVMLVDTYGDLQMLYSQCLITYLGGGFDQRKRGFDPMESLAACVPVITGPIYDYNRVAVDALSDTGWVNVLPDKSDAVENFVDIAGRILKSFPDIGKLNHFIEKRRSDPFRAAAEIMADLAGETKESYLFPENAVFSRDRIELAELLI